MKKDHIVRCIELGLDFFRSCLIAQCTEEEIQELEEDKNFQNELELRMALEEKELLEVHHSAMTMAAKRGNTKPIEWKLGKINPGRWGNGNDSGNNKLPDQVTVMLKGVSPDGKKIL